jgi:hypothetical protein
MATGLERTAVSPHTMQAGQAAPQRPSLTQTAMNPLARAYQLYQQYVGEPFQQTVRGGVRGYFGLPMMTDASSVGREAYRQGEALGFTPGVGMPAGAVRVAAEGMQALPSIAGDIGRVISGLPSGAAARQAEDFAAYQRSIPPSDVSPLTAFHGTPHTFPAEEGAPLGRFRAEKIGSGEGAQMYGHGLYFAEAPGVAGYYKTNLSLNQGVFDLVDKKTGAVIPEDTPGASIVKQQLESYGADLRSSDIPMMQERWKNTRKTLNERLGELPKLAKQYAGDPEYLAIISSTRKEYIDRIKELESASNLIDNVKRRPTGSLYTVDIPDEMVDKMLDGNKPLTQQPKEVQQNLQTLVDSQFGKGTWSAWSQNDPDYKDLANDLFSGKSAAEVSELLRQSGIPGLRYLDQGSRGATYGTRNIVVFPGEEQNVKILSRE